MVVRPLRMAPPYPPAALQVVGGDVAVDAEFAARDADQDFVLDHHGGRRTGLTFLRVAVLRLPHHFPILGIERHQRRVGLMQEDLTVGICEAAIDRVAAHHGNDVWILLGLVLPEDLRLVLPLVGTHSMGKASSSVSQHNGGVGAISVTPRLAYEDTSGFPST